MNHIIVLASIGVFPNWEPKEQWEENAVKLLLREQLITSSPGRHYELTERGRCFMDYISGLPYPVKSWKMP